MTGNSAPPRRPGCDDGKLRRELFRFRIRIRIRTLQWTSLLLAIPAAAVWVVPGAAAALWDSGLPCTLPVLALTSVAWHAFTYPKPVALQAQHRDIDVERGAVLQTPLLPAPDVEDEDTGGDGNAPKTPRLRRRLHALDRALAHIVPAQHVVHAAFANGAPFGPLALLAYAGVGYGALVFYWVIPRVGRLRESQEDVHVDAGELEHRRRRMVGAHASLHAVMAAACTAYVVLDAQSVHK